MQTNHLFLVICPRESDLQLSLREVKLKLTKVFFDDLSRRGTRNSQSIRKQLEYWLVFLRRHKTLGKLTFLDALVDLGTCHSIIPDYKKIQADTKKWSADWGPR